MMKKFIFLGFIVAIIVIRLNLTSGVFAAGTCGWVTSKEVCTGQGGVVAPNHQCGGGGVGTEVCCCISGGSGSDDLSPTSIPNPTGLENIGQLITRASGITTPFAVVGFIFSVIYAGFVRMTAAGNPEKEAKSMKIAIAAAVGFIIITLAPLFVRVLGSFLEVDQSLIQ